MKKYVLALTMGSLFVSNLNALDVRVGKGDFDWKVGMSSLFDTSVNLDIDVISFNEQHLNFEESNFYIFGNMDIYSSDRVDQATDIIDNVMMQKLPNTPIDNILGISAETPNDVLGNFVPVPSSYEISGIDFNIGLGYDVLKSENGYFGMGVMTGVSTPFLEMENPIDAMIFTYEFLKKTDTELMTYKAGLSFQAGYDLGENLSLYSTFIYAYQTGDIENSIINSSMDLDGNYQAFDIGIKLRPSSDSSWSNLYATLGYTSKDWDVDTMEATVVGMDTPNIASIFKNDLSTDYTYFGIGYRF
jgi:hypothetical protein